jgi:hypothetical protein
MSHSEWASDRTWTILLLMGFLVVVIANGLGKGEATVVYKTYKKSEDPELYWAGIVVPALLLAGLVYGLWFQ